MERIPEILSDLDKANAQRRRWLFASSFIVIGIAIYIAFWNWFQDLENPFIEWTFISVGLIVTVNWWYWTMHLVRKYLDHQKQVICILDDIVTEIKIVKADVKELNKPVDNKE